MTHTKPAAPGQPSVSRDSESQLTISWNKVSGATKYKLLYRKADGSNSSYVTLANNLTATSYTHKKLSAGTKYCYRVVAVKTGEVGPEGSRSIKNVESDQSATKVSLPNLPDRQTVSIMTNRLRSFCHGKQRQETARINIRCIVTEN